MASVIGYLVWQITWSPRKPKITIPQPPQSHNGGGQGTEGTGDTQYYHHHFPSLSLHCSDRVPSHLRA